MPDWHELGRSRSAWSVVFRVLGAAALVAVIAGGFLLVDALGGLKETNTTNKDALIRAGERRLEKSVTEHTRTQTMMCFAHEDRRRENVQFDKMCEDVISRWGVTDPSNAVGE